jgi:hypothetical protein
MKWLKIGGVVFGAMAITALGIDAADTLRGSNGTLLGQLAGSRSGECPSGMVEVESAITFRCVDKYEASPSENCPVKNIQNEFDTQKNIDDSTCKAVSVEKSDPWRYINRETAQLACVRSGKRLPINEEWQLFAAGTPDKNDVCNISSNGVNKTGSKLDCVSATGVFDAVGNVWEWTHDDVFDGVYNGRDLPPEGYVAQVDRAGLATLTSTSTSALFNDDYFWSKKIGAYAIMRGGFYGSKSDAGVYTAHAATLPTMQGVAIGFRCVQ